MIEERLDDILNSIIEALEIGDKEVITKLMEGLHPSEIATICNNLNRRQTYDLFSLINAKIFVDSTPWFSISTVNLFIEKYGLDTLVAYLNEMEASDVPLFLDNLDKKLRDILQNKISLRQKRNMASNLFYNKEQIGRFVHNHFVVKTEHTVLEILADLQKERNSLTSEIIFVLDLTGKVVGTVDLITLYNANHKDKISSIMNDDFKKINGKENREDVALLFRDLELKVVPVVDDNDDFLGVVDATDIIEIIYAENREDMLHLSGVDADVVNDDDASPRFHFVFLSAFRRFRWLTINLFSVTVVTPVIVSHFSSVVKEVVLLSALIPIITATAGNAGLQSVVVTISNLVDSNVKRYNIFSIVFREIRISLILSIMFFIITFPIIYFWLNDIHHTYIIVCDMFLTVLFSVCIGTIIPLLLDKFNIDPSISSSIFVTTLTDIFGFFIVLYSFFIYFAR